jgi:transposase-like protein
MIEVADAAAARKALARRMLRCPDCRAALKPWGQARPRTVRDLGGGLVAVRPDRARCTGCRRTHVVLDAGLLPRRAYTVRFLGQALAGAVGGRGHRQIASELGAPEGTVRGWLRRARSTAELLRWIGVQAVVALDPDALPAADRGDPLAHAIEALVAAAVAAHRRFGHGPREIWPRIALLTRGRLLAPSPTG